MRNKIDECIESVIIFTLNRPDKILNCIRSIRIQNVLPKEIIVVDAGNVEGLENSIKEEIGKNPIDFVYIHEKPSTTIQRNKGADLSTEDILVFLDDDVILEENFIKNVINTEELVIQSVSDVINVSPINCFKNKKRNIFLNEIFQKRKRIKA